MQQGCHARRENGEHLMQKPSTCPPRDTPVNRQCIGSVRLWGFVDVLFATAMCATLPATLSTGSCVVPMHGCKGLIGAAASSVLAMVPVDSIPPTESTIQGRMFASWQGGRPFHKGQGLQCNRQVLCVHSAVQGLICPGVYLQIPAPRLLMSSVLCCLLPSE
jgi:hypothetical protein